MKRERDLSPSPLDELYAAPLTVFTATRDALAARLDQQGRTAEGRAVKRLRKPTVVVWVINQLARKDPSALVTFLDAAPRLKRAQLTRRDELPAATQAHRTALQALIKRAVVLLREAGTAVSPAVERRLSATLMGAATDPRLADQAQHGRLTKEQQAPGFEVFGEQMPVSPAPAPAATPRPPATGSTTRPAEAPQVEQAQEAQRAREARAAAKTAAREQAARHQEAQRLARTAAQRRVLPLTPPGQSRRRASGSTSLRSGRVLPSRPPWRLSAP